MKLQIFPKVQTSNSLLLLKKLQSPYSSSRRHRAIKESGFINNNFIFLQKETLLAMQAVADCQQLMEWVYSAPKEQLNEIFTIRSEESIEMIINKIEEDEREINFQFLTRRKEDQQAFKQFVLDLSKFSIAWTSNPVIFIDPDWALQYFEVMINDYNLKENQQFQYLRNKKEKEPPKARIYDDLGLYNNEDYEYEDISEPKVSLKSIIIHCLIREVMEVRNTKRVPEKMKDISQIKAYALEHLSASEEYIKRVLQMTISQAIVENSFTKYRVAGRKIEDFYYEYKKEKALAVLEQEQKGKPAKKKKKNKKVEQKPEEVAKVEQIVKVDTQKQVEAVEETKQNKVADKKKKKKKQKSKGVETVASTEASTQEVLASQQKSTQFEKIELPIEKEQIQTITTAKPAIEQPLPPQKKKAKKPKIFNPQKATKCFINSLNSLLSSKMQEINTENQNCIDSKARALEMVFFHLNTQYPSLKVSMFGSLSTCTALPNSDIDLVIFSDQRQQFLQAFFDELTDSFLSKTWVTSCKFIRTAKVPILKLIIDPTAQPNTFSPYKLFPISQQQDLASLIKFDISFHSDNDIANSGIISTCYMSHIMNIQPKIRQLYMLLKYIFTCANLNEIYKGGFSSYCIFVMMIAVIEEKKIIVEETTQAEFLIVFLQFFAKEFEPNKSILRFVKNYPSVVSSEEYDTYFQAHYKSSSQTSKFKLVDPISGNFITASFSRYGEMVSLFENSLKTIEELVQLALSIGESLAQGAKEKNVCQMVEKELVKTEEMATFCKIIP